MAVKSKSSSSHASFHVIVGTDDGMVREEALALYNQLTGVNVFPIFLAVPNTKNFDLAGLQHVLEQTQRADQALVTTGLDHRLVLHRLIAEIAAARKSR